MDLYFSNSGGLRFRFPVTPRALSVTDRSRNTVVPLVDNAEISVLGGPGLREVAFEALLPNVKYHFAVYPDGAYQPAQTYLSFIQQLRTACEPFWFVLGGEDEGYSLRVTLEDFTITNDAANGRDLMVAIRLREYRGTELGVSTTGVGNGSGPPAQERDPPVLSVPGTYVVVRGDTLWAIAKRFLNDGARWPEIHALNKDKVSNPNLIYAGQELTLP